MGATMKQTRSAIARQPPRQQPGSSRDLWGLYVFVVAMAIYMNRETETEDDSNQEKGANQTKPVDKNKESGTE